MTPRVTPRPDSIEAACAALGIDRLTGPQRAAIDAVVAGRDAVVVMPTGAGKTAVYLVAGAVRGGLTVVVSPLRALQRDQLPVAGRVGRAELCNADLGVRRRARVLDAVAAGTVDFLLLGPEQFQKPDVVAALASAPPTLLAVDEAHCLSAWGPDFRPDYLRLGGVAGLLDRPPVVALTATAAPPVRAEVSSRLGLVDPFVVVTGFDRPEIHLAVEHHHDATARDDALVALAASFDGSGLVYTATRARTAQLAAALTAAGVTAAAYHGSLRANERRQIEEAWKSGATRVVAATTAFGMGIDKPDVRFVLHAEMAESLDSYAQEIGRAGRDGQPATAVLFHRTEDAGLRRFFATRRSAPLDRIARLLDALRAEAGPLDAASLDARALAAAEAAGALEVLPGGAVVLAPGAPGAAEVAEVGRRAAEAAERLERSRVEMIERYAGTSTCRRRVLLGYFGEESPERCDNCDVCDRHRHGGPDAQVAAARSRDSGNPWTSGQRVAHPEFGHGEVLSAEGRELVVVFDDAGYRTLDAALVADGHLLTVLD